MRVIIAGSQSITDKELVYQIIRSSGFLITEVVCGKAPGVDEIGEEWAIENHIPVKPFPADWDNIDAPGAVVKRRKDGTFYNAAAGPWRNEAMAKYANALIAIQLNNSGGTENMIRQAIKYGLKRFVVRINN